MQVQVVTEAESKRKRRAKVRRIISNTTAYIFLGLLGLVMVYPLLWLFASSFKENSGIFTSISVIPPNLNPQHYIEGWKGVGEYTFTTFFGNTFAIVIPSTIFIIISIIINIIYLVVNNLCYI